MGEKNVLKALTQLFNWYLKKGQKKEGKNLNNLKTLTQVTIELRTCKSVSVDKIIKVGMFELILYKEVTSTLPKYILKCLTGDSSLVQNQKTKTY